MRTKEERRAALRAHGQRVAAERLAKIERSWLAFEQRPAESEPLEALQRELHTLKAELKAIGFHELSSVSHALETLMEAIARGQRTPAGAGAVVLATLDTLRTGAARDVPDPEGQHAALIDRLAAAEHGAEAGTVVAPRPSPAAAAAAPAADGGLRLSAGHADALIELVGELQVGAARGEFAIDSLRHGLESLQQALGPQGELIDAELRHLLVLAREEQESRHHDAQTLRELDHKLRELQLVPAQPLFDRARRMVRDLAGLLGKAVRFDAAGETLELDRRVLEQLEEPVLHLLRNALDHALEPPEQRAAAGKPPSGVITLSLRLHGGELELTVADDGAGISADRCRARAIEQKLISAAEAAALSDADALQLVFLRGFSTREQANALSGRGLGMDIVKRTAESLRGRVLLRSTPGSGTVISVQVPRTLSLTRALVLRLGDHLYGIASQHVEQLGAIDGPDAELPPLSAALGLPPGETRVTLSIRAGEGRARFLGPRPWGELELVARPVKGPLSRWPICAGAALLQTGETVLLLEPAQLIALAKATTVKGPQRPRPVSVLLAEDSEVFAKVIAGAFHNLGHTVEIVPDGNAALSALERELPDVLFTDLEMPGLDGLQLIRRVRSDPRLQKLPVVVLSAFGESHDKLRGMEAGADAYLVKTAFDETLLSETLQRLVTK